jgi:transketolase
MLNPKIKLNTKVFNDDVEQQPTRKGFGTGLLEAGKKNGEVVALCADLTESTQMHLFAEAFPERFVQAGVAEQNLVTVAAGLAAMGKVPFCSSYAMFSPGRNWEQIRTTACYNDQKVVVVGSHAGVSVGPDGGTHQALEDIALMRILPNMTVLYPCDMHEAHKATLAAAECKGPVYLRLAREKSAVMTTPETPFELGKAQVVWEPDSGLAHVGVDDLTDGNDTNGASWAAQQQRQEANRVDLGSGSAHTVDERKVIAAREALRQGDAITFYKSFFE